MIEPLSLFQYDVKFSAIAAVPVPEADCCHFGIAKPQAKVLLMLKGDKNCCW